MRYTSIIISKISFSGKKLEKKNDRYPKFPILRKKKRSGKEKNLRKKQVVNNSCVCSARKFFISYRYPIFGGKKVEKKAYHYLKNTECQKVDLVAKKKRKKKLVPVVYHP